MAKIHPSMPHDAITQNAYAERVVATVLEVATLPRAGRRPWLIGLSGLQGSGKSTLAAQVVAVARRNGIAGLALSIDDFYLGRAARRQLARNVHPLLATRGVPGTHDVDLLLHTLNALRTATPDHPARVPRFDKGRDTRLPPARWRRIGHTPGFVILEGWCIGVPAQSAAALRQAINRLERLHDSDVRWRTWVNAQLRQSYAPLWQRLDRLVLLEAPDYAIVRRWRDQQEQPLRRRKAPRAMSPAALRQFLTHYERLSRHALQTLPERADLLIVLGRDRRVRHLVRCR
jgi:D-glycerate 3-kinase